MGKRFGDFKYFAVPGILFTIMIALIAVNIACPKKIDNPNKVNALRVAYDRLPPVYDALLEHKVITPHQYNTVIVPGDKLLYLGIQGAWIAVDTTGTSNLEAYKAKIKEGLDLLDTIQDDKLQAATAAIRVLMEAL